MGGTGRCLADFERREVVGSPGTASLGETWQICAVSRVHS